MDRIHRLGDRFVNFFLVEGDDGLTLVDAGLPSHHAVTVAAIAALGKPLRAILLTHAHLDHIGLAARLSTETGADVWVHPADAPLLADPLHPGRAEASLVPYVLRRPAALRTPLHLARSGAFRTRPLTTARPLDGDPDVPGNPSVIPLPGHTKGSVAFHFPSHGGVFTGDALVTHDSIVGRTGPCTVCRAFTVDSAAALRSLDALGALDAEAVLPGHGDPYPGSPKSAATLAREAGIR